MLDQALIGVLRGRQQQHARAHARRLLLGSRAREAPLQAVDEPCDRDGVPRDQAEPRATIPVVLLPPRPRSLEEIICAAYKNPVVVHPYQLLELHKPPDLQFEKLVAADFWRTVLLARHVPVLSQNAVGHRHGSHRQNLDPKFCEARGHGRAVGPARGVRQEDQRVLAELADGVGHGEHAPQAVRRLPRRVVRHHHEGEPPLGRRVDLLRRMPVCGSGPISFSSSFSSSDDLVVHVDGAICGPGSTKYRRRKDEHEADRGYGVAAPA
mmetsp:Transcript_95285/g.238831  ORF Transcript_95285/g.238831 Transcript_95285/m.238831 type:complete len:267 (-) Transcript_95285:95-895(-)